MCGFLFTISNKIINEKKLKQSLELIKYRGPDETNCAFETVKQKKIFAGHNRLSIVDLNSGSQPMYVSEKNLLIVFNGEIYNHQDLRKILIQENYKFSSVNSDTEVILNGYKKWGSKITDYLNGMWSFVILDKRNNKIFISRDRFGEKPLFYYFDNFYFSISSELKALKALHNEEIQIDQKSLMKYCAYGFFPKNTTPFKKVFQLDAGCNLIYDIPSHNYKIIKYWNYKLEPETNHKEAYWIEKLEDVLNKSVNQRLQADTEVGIFLSGGLDSSIITHLASKNYNKKLKTFSINFQNKELNEKKFSDLISNKYLTDHHEINFDNTNNLKFLNDYLNDLNDLLSDSSLISYYQLCKLASKNVKVVLGGDGSDELFAGYSTFSAFKIAEKMQMNKRNFFPKIINIIAKILPFKSSNMNTKFMLSRFSRFNDHKPYSLSNPIWLSPLSIENINKLFDTKIQLEEIYEDAIEDWDKSNLNNFDKV